MTYDECVHIATKQFDFDPSFQLFLACGTVAGCFAQTAVYPLDVIRRIQLYGYDVEPCTGTNINSNHNSILHNTGENTNKKHQTVSKHTRDLRFWMSNAIIEFQSKSIFERMKPDFLIKTRHLIEKQGVRALFNGLLPTYLKTVPCFAMGMTVRDVMLGKVKKTNYN